MSYPRIDDYTENHGDTRIEIFYDEHGDSPREWDNLSTLVCFHNRYRLGDSDHGYSDDSFDGWDDVLATIRRDHDPVVILPLFLYDHSGITIRAGSLDGGNPFSDPWDSGCVGFAFVSRAKYDAEAAHGYTVEQAEATLRAEVETYDAYLRGEVYGYVVSKVTTCDHGDEHTDVLESVWGFYSVEDALNEATAYVGVEVKGY